ncbi:MAG TPA: alpha/beta hydrolase [Rhizomicrobium sp.]|nr:alpha/beta hydrolase [Rhizomicrobium sp.]
MPDLKELSRPDGETIAYMARAGKAPGVVWLGGFKSEMSGTKASALHAWAARKGHAFLRFDYFGHGRSSGDFRMGTISRWREDALTVLDNLTEGPQILVGSSMGGWLALLAALARPEKVAGMLLIAPAADFTEELLWARLPEDARRLIVEKGEWLRPSAYDPDPYPITRGLIEDGRKHLVMGAPIRLSFPVRIVQGMKDPDVPWEHALKLTQSIEGDVTLTLVKQGDHRLSTPDDIRLIEQMLDGLVMERTE